MNFFPFFSEHPVGIADVCKPFGSIDLQGPNLAVVMAAQMVYLDVGAYPCGPIDIDVICDAFSL